MESIIVSIIIDIIFYYFTRYIISAMIDLFISIINIVSITIIRLLILSIIVVVLNRALKVIIFLINK